MLHVVNVRRAKETKSNMNPFLDRHRHRHSLQPTRNPLIDVALQQHGYKFLIEADNHSHPPTDWQTPKGWRGAR